MNKEFENLIEMHKNFVLNNISELAFTGETEALNQKDLKRIWFILKNGNFRYFDITPKEYQDFIEYHKANFKTTEVKQQ